MTSFHERPYVATWDSSVAIHWDALSCDPYGGMMLRNSSSLVDVARGSSGHEADVELRLVTPVVAIAAC